MSSDERHCVYCGERIEPSMGFCPSCGSKIVWREEGVTAPPTATPVTQEFLLQQQNAEKLAKAKNDVIKGVIAFVILFCVFVAWALGML